MTEHPVCYLVSSGSYSDYRVHAVYLDRELAEEAVTTMTAIEGSWMDYGVEECPLGDAKPRLYREYVAAVVTPLPAGWGDERRQMAPYLSENYRGEETWIFAGSVPNPPPVKVHRVPYYHPMWKGTDRQAVLKAAGDYLAQLNAERLEL